jgi:hypothetical protein
LGKKPTHLLAVIHGLHQWVLLLFVLFALVVVEAEELTLLHLQMVVTLTL